MGPGLIAVLVFADSVPARAADLAPVLVQVQQAHWPDAPEPWTLAGKVEQETCITLRHRVCWNPKAELKTSREYGFGLGQVTVAYRADGSERFNKFAELKREHQELAGWSWESRYDAATQLLAVVLMGRDLFRRVPSAASLTDRWAFSLAAYNGGMGGVVSDRRLCANTADCDPMRWFGHVERTSLKTRLVNPGYRKSAFEINREYVRNILTVRRAKYRRFWS